jgi:hypothetical protein
MPTSYLYRALTKVIKYLLPLVSTITLTLPLTPAVISLTSPANLNLALSHPQYIPKDKIISHSLDDDSRVILSVNDTRQRYGWNQAKALLTPATLASTEVFTIYLPIAFTQRPPVVNGDFEMGRAYSDLIIGSNSLTPASINPPLNWTRFSRIGYELFFTQSSDPLRLPIPAESGIWATWLGGDNNEISYIEQQVHVPISNPFLIFSYWIQSYDSFCGTQLFSISQLLSDFVATSPVGGLPVDMGGVVIDDNSGVLGVVVTDLCLNSQTNGWSFVIINLSQYSGETVRLQIRSKGDTIFTSSFFIDNVSLGDTVLTSTSFGDLSLVAKPSLEPSNQALPLNNTDESVWKSMLITPNTAAGMTKKGNAQTPVSSEE